MSNKRRSRKAKKKNLTLQLKEVAALNRRLGSHVSVDEVIRDVKSKYRTASIPSNMSILYKNALARKRMEENQFPSSVGNIADNLMVITDDLDRELLWLAGLINHHSREIVDLISLKNAFESKCLQADYLEADKILTIIHRRFGWSLWYIENKLNLLEKLEGLNAQKAFYAKINNNDDVNAAIKYFAYIFSYRAESTISAARFDAISTREINFLGLQKELREAFLFRINVFEGDEWFQHLEKVIVFNARASLIDGYITFVRVIQLLLAGKGSANYLDKAVSILRGGIDDELLEVLCLYSNIDSFNMESVSNSKSKGFISILDAYTLGRYEEAVQEGVEFINQYPSAFEAYELVARSLARMQSEDGIACLNEGVKKLLRMMVDVIQKNTRCYESYLELMKLVQVYSSHNWAPKLYSFLNDNYLRSHHLKKNFNNLGVLNSLLGNPFHCLVLNPDEGAKYISQLKLTYPESATLKFLEGYALNSFDEVNFHKLNLPSSRASLYQAKMLLREDRFVEAEQILISVKAGDDIVHSYEAIYLYINTLIALNKVSDAIDVMADEYLKNEDIIFYLSISYLETINFYERQDLLKKVSTSIVYHVYKSIAKNYDDVILKATYLQVLNDKAVDRGSAIIPSVTKKDLKLIYFLAHVCMPNIYNTSRAFSSREDVTKERLEICKALTLLDPKNAPSYSSEIKNLTRHLMIESTTKVLDNSKIYADTAGIFTSIERELIEKYKRYFTFVRSGLVEQHQTLDYLRSDLRKKDGEGLKILVPKNEPNELFSSIIDDVRKEFISSNEYGLEGYISNRIRHGSIVNELLRPFLKEFLVTSLENGEYKNNEYWLRVSSPLSSQDEKLLINAFAAFSKQINESINHLKNEVIQFKSDDKLNGLFIIKISSEQIRTLQRNIEADTSLDDFYQKVIDLLWIQTEENLLVIREYLSNSLLPEMNVALQLLESKVRGLPGDFKNIILNISNARREVHSAILVVRSWFERVDDIHAEDIPLPLFRDFLVETINNLNPNRNVKLEVEVEEGTAIKGKVLNSFTGIFYMLIDNAIKHSGFGDGPLHIEGEIKVSPEKNEIYVMMKNPIASHMNAAEEKTRIDHMLLALNKTTSYSKIRVEGGTSLSK